MNKKRLVPNTIKGFTIIELLVVVAVIGLLAAFILASFAQPKTKSRDARREVDMKELRNGLNLYINNNSSYPVCSLGIPTDSACGGQSLEEILRSANAMSAAPRDPLSAGDCDFQPGSHVYCYESNANGTSYFLYYHLETNSIANPSGAPVDGAPGWYVISP